MRLKKIELLVGLAALVGLWAFVSVAVHAQTPKPTAKSAKSARPAAQSSADTSDKPYDWKASFAKVPVGKVPRMPDGKPSLQGIWSRAILTPLEPHPIPRSDVGSFLVCEGALRHTSSDGILTN